jgi:hydrogenase-1 operon protein HyaF
MTATHDSDRQRDMDGDRDRALAREIMAEFLERMSAWRPGGRTAPSVDLLGVPPAALAIVNEVTGEGEVGIRLAGDNEVRIQETVFAGVWRVCRLDSAGHVVEDRIEGGAIPDAVLQAARLGARPALEALETLDRPDARLPEGVMNAPALLHEIGAQMAAWQPGDPAHVINLTLLPLSAGDHALLAQALPQGPVSIMSRGFGNCRISSTTARNVWRVQYFNNLQTLILDTIEVVDVPEVALAAVEDIADSRERLAELLDWMGEPIEA